VLEGPIAIVKHKVDVALKTAIGGLIALTAIVVALGFFCAAAFLWIETRYGVIEAALILAGAFVVIAVIALIAVAVVQRRKPPPSPPAARKPWWTDPALAAAALDAGRGLGRRRGVAVTMVIAAFAIGALLPWMPRRPPKDRD
jgi:hypothetical protein